MAGYFENYWWDWMLNVCNYAGFSLWHFNLLQYTCVGYYMYCCANIIDARIQIIVVLRSLTVERGTTYPKAHMTPCPAILDSLGYTKFLNGRIWTQTTNFLFPFPVPVDKFQCLLQGLKFNCYMFIKCSNFT